MTDRGSATVEFALVIPAILLLLVVVIEAGGLVRSHLLALHAAREGARAAATTTDLDAVVATTRRALGRDGADARISIDREWVVGGSASVRVEVPAVLFSSVGAGLPIRIRAGATMQVER